MGDSVNDLHEEWVNRVVEQHGPVIRARYNPANQQRMRPNVGAWLRWNPGDGDVRWALDHYREGVNRNDLKGLSSDLGTNSTRRRAFVVTLLWGVGPTNRYYGRHAEALAHGDLDAMLKKSAIAAQRGDLAGGWSAIYGLPGLGFRFFTKWLWVAGMNAELATPPLVFDQRVIDSLRRTRWPFQLGEMNFKQRWLNYCADAAAVGNELGVTGEWVEHWLFNRAPIA
ncbi:8-oxoguanine DNA glycosylase OGG fold protein [Mycolicibacterium arenosum]|uniref:Uncharacterized protein n=1 Tax=Mycolicibacterium arenosum TaxID=2952157 RepID=A0ABT1M4I1_9MYCO|nr:hypothetical protein [Mycolicibacterium sp. CAU 1645]MCP9274076.1 hypothetical protein [Mycolicibacterium sp. CAU 1645]